MDGGLGFRRDNKTTKFFKSYKGEKIVERHDQKLPEGTWHIVDICKTSMSIFILLLVLLMDLLLWTSTLQSMPPPKKKRKII